LFAAAILFVNFAAYAQSPDWTQFGGPHRDFIVDAKGLASTWPATGPKRLWQRELGEGYSAIAAEGGRLYTMYHKGDQEIVIALDAHTGQTLWESPYRAEVTDKMTQAIGPRATPLILGNWLFTVGALGNLYCLDKQTGKPRWTHDLYREFKGNVQDEYYAASPLPYKNLLIVPVGGPGASVIAFNQQDGAVIWKRHDFKAAYASPILIRVDGQEQVALVMEEDVIGLEPNTGSLLWRHPHRNRTKTNVTTPVWGQDNLLLVSSAYDSGSRMLRLTRQGATTTVEELWYQRLLRTHFTNLMRLGDTVYGSSGDFGPAPFTALDAQTGALLWRDRSIGRASFLYADGKFILLDEDGNLYLATPAKAGLTILAKAALLSNRAWTPPTLTGTTLYLRDQKVVLALDLK
jgi:outer membrane protein assembly factor BamB